ncbi:hypothetical protein ACLOJK_034087 [Asimina triloba]
MGFPPGVMKMGSPINDKGSGGSAGLWCFTNAIAKYEKEELDFVDFSSTLL